MDNFNLDQFAQERAKFLSELFANPRRVISNLYYEKTKGIVRRKKETTSLFLELNRPELCCLIGKTEYAPVGDLPHVCKISILTELGKGKTGEIYNIRQEKNNKFQPTNYIIKVQKVTTLNSTFVDRPPKAVKFLRDRRENVELCLFSDININTNKYVGSDGFTNEILIGYILDHMYKNHSNNSGLKGYVEHYTATICNEGTNRFGINFMELADLGDINQFIKNPIADAMGYHESKRYKDNTSEFTIIVLTPDVIIDLAKQMIANLYFLQTRLFFNHGDLKTANVVVKTEKTNIDYEGMVHSSDISFKIADYEKAALTIRNGDDRLRFYNRIPTADIYLTQYPFRPVIRTSFNVAYYIVDELLTVQTLAKSRHSGISFYNSWDTIVFFVSLFMLPNIFYPLFTTPKLKQVLWDPIWHPEDESIVFDRIAKIVREGRNNNTGNIIQVLKGIRIKCRLTYILFDLLKTFKL